MSRLTRRELFHQSLDRCGASDTFIPSFYDRFLATSDEIREKFAETDFSVQNRMLLRSLRLSADATEGSPSALREIRERAETHDRHHLDIEPRLYDYWLSAVIATAAEHDDQWNAEIEESWRAILGYVIHHMTKFY